MSTVTKITETTFKEIFVRNENYAWCRLLLEESTGRVVIISDYGSWTYCWSHIGEKTLEEFLAQLDRDYMGHKMLGVHSEVIDEDATQEAIKQEIFKQRRVGSFSRDEARAEYSFLQELTDGCVDFNGWASNTAIDDCYEYQRRCINPCWANFWKYLWRPLIKPALLPASVEASAGNQKASAEGGGN